MVSKFEKAYEITSVCDLIWGVYGTSLQIRGDGSTLYVITPDESPITEADLQAVLDGYDKEAEVSAKQATADKAAYLKELQAAIDECSLAYIKALARGADRVELDDITATIRAIQEEVAITNGI